MKNNRFIFSGAAYEAHVAFWEEEMPNLLQKFALQGDQIIALAEDRKSQEFKLNDACQGLFLKYAANRTKENYFIWMSALSLLLSRYSNQETIQVISPFAQSSEENLTGQKWLPVSLKRIKKDSLKEHILQLSAQLNQYYKYQHYPLDMLSAMDGLSLEPSVFSNILVSFEGLHVPLDEEQINALPLHFKIKKNSENSWTNLEINYQEQVFSSAFVDQLGQHLLTILEQFDDVNRSLEKIDFLNDVEQEKLTKAFNATGMRLEQQSVVAQFRQTAAQYPQHLALRYQAVDYTYQELDLLSDQLSAHLSTTLAIEKGEGVGILLEKTDLWIVSLLSVLKAGAVYVPISLDYPQQRKAYIINDAKIKQVILSSEHLKEAGDLKANLLAIDVLLKEIDRPSGMPADPCSLEANDPAYIIYTSGSTGKPKGVRIPHIGLLNSAQHYIQTFGMSTEDAYLQFLSNAFDGSLIDVFTSLLSGASLIIPPSEVINDPDQFKRFLDEESISGTTLTPSYLSTLEKFLPKKLRFLLSAGEAVNIEDATFYGQHIDFYNAYGPTEAAIVSNLYLLEKEKTYHRIPIGKPTGNKKIYILDEARQLMPIACKGEIYIAGLGIASEYVNRPNLTEQQFIESPFEVGEVLYKTGDTGRWLFDGTIDFMGRIAESQVKIRGFRVELEEIAVVLRQHEALRDALVLYHSFHESSSDLIAFVIDPKLASGEVIRFDDPAFLKWLDAQLPYFMRPNLILSMAEFPQTINGKVDKKALLKLARKNIESTLAIEPPQNDIEAQLINAYSEVLSFPQESIGRNSDFFALGGHSLAISNLIKHIYNQFQITLTFKDVFEHPKVLALAKIVETKAPESTATILKAAPSREDGCYPLSDTQKQIWMLEQKYRNPIGFNVTNYYHLLGPLNVAFFKKAIEQVIRRHESLRTLIVTKEGQPQQQILSFEDCRIELEIIDLRKAEDAEKSIGDQARADAQFAFNLETGPLMTLRLLQVKEEAFVFLMTLHHIITDGQSVQIIFREIITGYNALLHDLPFPFEPLPIQYKDFALWQTNSKRAAIHRAYWLEELAAPISRLQLNTDYNRPDSKSFRGGSISFGIDDGQSQQLQAFCHRRKVSMYMLFSAIINFLLYRYSSQTNIIIGSPVAGRAHSDLDNLVGFFVNMLAFRTQLQAEGNFDQLLEQIKNKTLSGYEHQNFYFNELVESLALTHSSNRGALYDVYLDVQFRDTEDAGLPAMNGIAIKAYELGYTKCQYDLEFVFTQQPHEIKAKITYSADLFHKDRIEALKNHLLRVVDLLVQQETTLLKTPLSQIDYLAAEEKKALLTTFNATHHEYPTKIAVHQAFEKQVALNPTAPAVVVDGRTYSYEEINKKANKVANYLLENEGIQAESLVAVYCENTIEFIIAILSVLKSGAAYVPFDVHTSTNDRFKSILEQNGIELILSQSSFQSDLAFLKTKVIALDQFDETLVTAETNPSIAIPTHRLAYVMFTSGSTGAPKGVMIEHRNIVNLVYNDFGVTRKEGERILLTGALGFDASTYDIWKSLLHGSTLYLFPKNDLQEPQLLKQIIRDNQIDLIFLTTTWFNHLVDVDTALFTPLKVLITGGDMVSADHVRKLHLDCPLLKIIHAYGPTENTTFSTFYEVKDPIEKNIPIGRPLDNRQAFILDGHLNPVPAGIVGELYLSGDGLGRGYLNKEQLSQERFVVHPFLDGQSMYKTGDLACFNRSGEIIFIGRKDSQLKINGYRVEILEIASVFKQHPLIKDVYIYAHKKGRDKFLRCAIIPDQDNQLLKKLAASIALPNEKRTEQDHLAIRNFIKDIRQFAKHSLPGYMVPKAFVLMSKLPLNKNGKVDLEKVNPLFDHELPILEQHLLPRNEQEKLIAKIWQEVLGQAHIGIQDNFYDVGGDSVKAMQISSKLHKAKMKIEVRDIFYYQTIEAIAQQVAAIKRIPIQAPVEGSIVLSPIQRAFFSWKLKNGHHFNQALLLTCPDDTNPEKLAQIFTKLQAHHDMLRVSFTVDGETVEQSCTKENKQIHFQTVDLSDVDNPISVMDRLIEEAQQTIHIEACLWKGVYFVMKQTRRLFLVFHHLIIDAVSWRILLEDITTLYLQLEQQQALELPLKTDSFQLWTKKMLSYAQSPQLLAEKTYWQEIVSPAFQPLPSDKATFLNTRERTSIKKIELDESATNHLVLNTNSTFKVDVNQLLIAALSIALFDTFKLSKQLIAIESHGRIPFAKELDVVRTVGWFTSIFPIGILLEPGKDPIAHIQYIKQLFQNIPNKGIGYGLLQHLSAKAQQLEPHLAPQIVFNYLGQIDVDNDQSIFKIAPESTGQTISDQNERMHDLEISVIVFKKKLQIDITYNREQFQSETMDLLCDHYQKVLMKYVAYSTNKGSKQQQPVENYTSKNIPESNLEKLNQLFRTT